MDLRFRRPQHFENVDRVRLGRLRQRRRFDHFDDVRQVAMLVFVLEFDVEFRSGNAVALDAFHGEARAGAERVEPSEKCLSRRRNGQFSCFLSPVPPIARVAGRMGRAVYRLHRGGRSKRSQRPILNCRP